MPEKRTAPAGFAGVEGGGGNKKWSLSQLAARPCEPSEDPKPQLPGMQQRLQVP